MTFKPGQSGNPKGRTPGRPNAKTRAVLEKLNGVADSLALLGEMVASSETPLSLRMHAAIGLAPYQYPKAPRLLRKKIDLPEPATIEDATANLARIGALTAARRIGLDEASDLANLQKAFIEAKIGTELEQRITTIELALTKANLNLGIAVQGGMPVMPGHEDVIMPAKLLSARSQPSELPSPGDGDNGGGQS
jgi:hypothetical protein